MSIQSHIHRIVHVIENRINDEHGLGSKIQKDKYDYNNWSSISSCFLDQIKADVKWSVTNIIYGCEKWLEIIESNEWTKQNANFKYWLVFFAQWKCAYENRGTFGLTALFKQVSCFFIYTYLYLYINSNV